MTTDYQKQATDFCERFGIKFRATEYPADMQTAPAWVEDGNSGSHTYPHGLRYRVTLSRDGKADLGFDFWASIADREAIERVRKANTYIDAEAKRKAAQAKPTAYDVLACISSDIYCPDNFADFCDEYGYDEDSRKAYATWERCSKFAKELREFFATDEEREALAEIS